MESVSASIDDAGVESEDLAAPRGRRPVRLLLEHHQDDRAFAQELLDHLTPLKRSGALEVEVLAEEPPGEGREWTHRMIDRADVIGVMLSASYMASDRLPTLMERFRRKLATGDGILVPILTRPCLWERSELGSFHALPPNGRPISSWPERDEAYVAIANELRTLFDSVSARPDASPSQGETDRDAEPDPVAARKRPRAGKAPKNNPPKATPPNAPPPETPPVEDDAPPDTDSVPGLKQRLFTAPPTTPDEAASPPQTAPSDAAPNALHPAENAPVDPAQTASPSAENAPLTPAQTASPPAENAPLTPAQETSPPAEPPARPAAPRFGGRSGAINDRNYQDDQLGFATYVRAFADLIQSRSTSPPLTIGIFGSWGMGKSFLLRSIQAELEGRRGRPLPEGAPPRVDRVHMVTFNAWEYSQSIDVWPRLVRRILDELEVSPAWTPWGRVRVRWRVFLYQLRKTLRKAPTVLLWLFVASGIAFATYEIAVRYQLLTRDYSAIENAWKAVAAVAGTGLVGALLNALKDSVQKPLGEQVTGLFNKPGYGGADGSMKAIRADLEQLGHRLSKDTDRILVLIDDLDRCEPAKSVEVLKAINLLLDFDNFIVCLGIDARVTTRAIEHTYKDLLGPAGASGYEYLDKIVQIPFRIPPPRTEEIRRFLRRIMDLPAPAEKSPPPVEKTGDAEARDGERASPNTGAPSPRDTGAPPPGDSGPSTEASPLGPSRPSTDTAPLDPSKPSPRAAPLDPSKQPTEVGPSKQPTKDARAASAAPSKSEAPAVERPSPDKPLRALHADETRAFTEDELAAFLGIADCLRPNPRHLKRLVNVYRLVRLLARYHQEETAKDPAAEAPVVLRKPASAIAWLAACSQWPYTMNLLLRELDDLDERGADQPSKPPAERPLLHLLDRATRVASLVLQRRLDHDPEQLRRLLARFDEDVTWDDLRRLRQYTVNFNPAVESEPERDAHPSKDG